MQRYESSALAEPIKAALRLADAYLADPVGFDDSARAQTLAFYTPAQVVEIVLKLLYFAGNKASIALGVDAPIDADRLSIFHYDDEGSFVVHGHGVVGRAH